MNPDDAIINAIDASPLNRGLRGVDWLNVEGNVPIVMGDDIALFDNEGGCTYQVHFLFVSRGRSAIQAAKESFRRMFEDYGADLIFGLVPNFRDDVKMLARWAGGKCVGKRGECELYVLSKEMWSDAK